MRALSRTPVKLIAVNKIRTIAAPTHVGKGKDGTSPARYVAAVAAETMAVEEKSSINKAAPISAKVFVETFSLFR